MNEIIVNIGMYILILVTLYVIYKIIKDLRYWTEIEENQAPKWVRKAANRFYAKCAVRPYDVRKHFVGKTYVYRVFYECVGQGQTRWHYYRKKRKGK